MRALVLEQPAPASASPLLLRDVRRPEPGSDELLLRVAACGVCRTDLQLAEGDLVARRLPIVPGHQIVGRVEAVGGDVSGLGARRAGRCHLAGRRMRSLQALPRGS